MDRVQADYTGMLGTVMNALVMADSLQQVGVDTRVQQPLPCNKWQNLMYVDCALRHLKKKAVLLSLVLELVHLTSPADTTAALRAAEIEADAILMAKNGVDGF